MDYSKLVKSAQKAKRYSYSPYSNFRVGAALLSSSGKIYTGCNIESSSYSLTICAERNAIFKAVSEGQHKFKAIAISSDLEEFISPCGACRQIIWDFADGIDVILVNARGGQRVVKTDDLLPLPFDSSVLNQGKRKRPWKK